MLRLKIVSPEKIVYQGDVESVLVPGTKEVLRFSTTTPRSSLLSLKGQWNTVQKKVRNSSIYTAAS